MTDAELMAGIRAKYSEIIAAACSPPAPSTPYGAHLVAPELVAGIVGNESGGDPAAQRFEPAVFARIQDVLAGKRSAFTATGIYRPLLTRDFLMAIDPASAGVNAPPRRFVDALASMNWLASSFGLTQIMGWHTIEFNRSASEISGVAPNLRFAVMLLGYFAGRYSLDATKDFGELLTCWNTGEPTGNKTFDPNYVANGLARIAAYSASAAPQG